MWDHKRDVWASLDCSRCEEAEHSAGGVEKEFHQRIRELRQKCYAGVVMAVAVVQRRAAHTWCCGMDEHCRRSSVQLVKDGVKRGVAEVNAVVSLDGDSMRVKGVEGVGDLS